MKHTWFNAEKGYGFISIYTYIGIKRSRVKYFNNKVLNNNK